MDIESQPGRRPAHILPGITPTRPTPRMLADKVYACLYLLVSLLKVKGMSSKTNRMDATLFLGTTSVMAVLALLVLHVSPVVEALVPALFIVAHVGDVLKAYSREGRDAHHALCCVIGATVAGVAMYGALDRHERLGPPRMPWQRHLAASVPEPADDGGDVGGTNDGGDTTS